ncbi:MAG: hypothetical protein Q8S21_05050 [Candidatus Paracaedibacteraceae bacterium]|nr:hypothetical protein [Candidatus Paracaedibacteraceae bacterium]
MVPTIFEMPAPYAKVGVLLVYGDGKEPSSNLCPSDLIQDIIQALGFEVGIVVNPAPIIRSPEAEKTSFTKKLS